MRQFEALICGSLHAARHEQAEASSGHQATSNQLPISTYSDPFLPTHSADDSNLKHYQVKDLQPADINHSSSPSSLAHSSSSGGLKNDDDKDSLIQPELAQSHVQPVRTAEVKLDSEYTAEVSCSPPSESQNEQPSVSRLSLFSGMELVTKGRPLCDRPLSERQISPPETDMEDDTLRENQVVHNSDTPADLSLPCSSETSEDASSVCSSVVSGSNQPVSAFSFLNS